MGQGSSRPANSGVRVGLQSPLSQKPGAQLCSPPSTTSLFPPKQLLDGSPTVDHGVLFPTPSSQRGSLLKHSSESLSLHSGTSWGLPTARSLRLEAQRICTLRLPATPASLRHSHACPQSKLPLLALFALALASLSAWKLSLPLQILKIYSCARGPALCPGQGLPPLCSPALSA